LKERAKTAEELNTRFELEAFSKERQICYEECSGLSGQGIWEGIDKLIAIFETSRDGSHLFP
jgi:hypothetical protein